MRRTITIWADWVSLADWSDPIFDAGEDPSIREWAFSAYVHRYESGVRAVNVRVLGFTVGALVRS
jgi:hypothetical protein